MNDLVICGCGSVGRMIDQIVFDINSRRQTWNLLGFVDDDHAKHGQTVAGYPVLGGIQHLTRYPAAYVTLGFSAPRQKRDLLNRLGQLGPLQFATLIHPSAWISRRVEIGPGCVIYPGVHIDVDVRIGRHVLLNKLCTVGHDSRLGDFVTAAPAVNLGGNNDIGEGVEFGINSASIQEIAVGPWSVVEAGCVVIRSVPPGPGGRGCAGPGYQGHATLTRLPDIRCLPMRSIRGPTRS